MYVPSLRGEKDSCIVEITLQPIETAATTLNIRLVTLVNMQSKIIFLSFGPVGHEEGSGSEGFAAGYVLPI